MTWPTDFPLPLIDGYVFTVESSVIRTDMDSGAARVRRRSTTAPCSVTVRYVFSEVQMTQFRALWETDFNFGANWVVLPIRTGRTVGVEYKSCRSSDGTFKATPVSASQWNVEMQLEVRNA